METLKVKYLKKKDSLEDFEFFDAEGDLNVDLSKSPIQGATEKLTSGASLVVAALCTIVEEQGLVVTIPVKTMAASAIGAVAGSLLGGPAGMAVGLITGAVFAYKASPNRSKSPQPQQAKSSIRQIFKQMTLQQKKELIKELLGCLKQSNVRSLILEILKNESIRNMAVDILSTFLLKRMGVSLVRPKL